MTIITASQETQTSESPHYMGGFGYEIKNFEFKWHITEKNRPDLVMETITVSFDMEVELYNLILETNHGEKPDIYGENADDAYEYLGEYIKDHKVCTYEQSCLCDDTGHCQGKTRKYLLRWNFRERNEHESFKTLIPALFCEKHYNEMCQRNEGKEPECYGWDYWDAIDSIHNYLEDEI